jgi:ATP-dependent RNA helicase DDX60
MLIIHKYLYVCAEVKIVKTSTAEEWKVKITPSMTVQDLRSMVCKHWPDLEPAEPSLHTQTPVQLFFNGADIFDPAKTLSEYGLFNSSSDIIYVPAHVHCLAHSTRFINLQRYLWDNSSTSLRVVSPLAAVNSVQDLRDGILQHSSLSFTSADSFRVFEEAKKLFPPEALQIISPYNFFGERERITLARVKSYEDLLKAGLQQLAAQFPAQTEALLKAFSIPDAEKSFDLCDLVLQLKQQDMLPCLPFHLNTFEAVKLFQQVLAGLEYRQKLQHPTYYMDLQAQKDRQRSQRKAQIKSTGGDAKKEEELERSGDIESAEGLTVDKLAPHPDFVVCKGAPLSDKELEDLVVEMEHHDGFERRDSSKRGQNLEILTHALVRGLRRGIGLFIEEVSFPAYRRAVQRLASQGKLGVVISDSSLAFGVNMPFRSKYL